VIVDPVTAHMGRKVDMFKDADVRAVLTPLAQLAERTGVAVLCIAHMNKDTQRRAIYRASGSVAFVAQARSVLAVVVDPDDATGDRRLLLPVKGNLGPKPKGLAFTTPGGRLRWEDGDVIMTVDEALREDDAHTTSQVERAEDFLRDYLAAGPKPAADVFEAARAEGISERTLMRAKARLRVESHRETVPGPWFWRLPAVAASAT